MSKRKALIRVFVAQDPKSRRLLEEIKDIIGKIPEDKRPEVKIHLVRVDNPSMFPEFLTRLEEIYGGLFTVEFRKYGVEKLPTIVINEKKVLEGRFPSREELIGILRSEGIEVPARLEQRITTPIARPPQPYYTPPAEEKPVLSQPPTPPPQLPPPSLADRPPLESEQPVQALEEKTSLETPLTLQPQQPQPPSTPTAKPTEEERNLRGTCYDCIFFDANRNWCLLLRTSVSDPLRPICGRRK